MSVTTVNYVRGRHDLTTTEFAVAYAMASHADPRRDRLCTASTDQLALESGIKGLNRDSRRRSIRRIIRRLEAKGVVAAVTGKAGGFHSETVGYEFVLQRGTVASSVTEDSAVLRGSITENFREPPRRTLRSGTEDPECRDGGPGSPPKGFKEKNKEVETHDSLFNLDED